MAVRILCWNIFEFSLKTVNDTPRINRILKWVNPAGQAPSYDVFVVLEPRNNHTVSRGDFALGTGSWGIYALLARLQARTATWKAAPPLSLCLGGKSETIAVFYDSAVVELVGPQARRGTVPAPWNNS